MGEIPTFTAAELMDPAAPPLPGWREPGNLPSMVGSMGRLHGWHPGISVSVFREAPDYPGEIETLTLVRGAATTHEAVLSTLTGQIPPEAPAILMRKREPYVVGAYPRVAIGMHGPDPRESAIVARYAPQLEGVPDPTSFLSLFCHDILSRKLGRPDLISMQSDDELGTVSLMRMSIGASGHEREGQPRFERLLLVGVAMMLHAHQAHVFDPDVHERMSVLPQNERRYSSLGWMGCVTAFPEAVRRKNVVSLAPYLTEGEAVTVCAQGQCLAMTAEVINSPDLHAHLGRASVDELDYGGLPTGDPYGVRALASRKR